LSGLRVIPIRIECDALVWIDDEWKIRLKIPNVVYKALRIEEREGEKVARGTVEGTPLTLILWPTED